MRNIENENAQGDFVILPLYSPTEKHGGREPVPERSHCNQWNADGRPRNDGELYISLPSKLRELHPNFFPPTEEQFTLSIPTGESFSAKICQEGGKALMTNPNDKLEPWLLREVLNLEVGELLKYSRLIELGFDSVKVSKIGDGLYSLELAGLGSYDEFVN